jgi:hypothetical protein
MRRRTRFNLDGKRRNLGYEQQCFRDFRAQKNVSREIELSLGLVSDCKARSEKKCLDTHPHNLSLPCL